jgi:hypothetical protein
LEFPDEAGRGEPIEDAVCSVRRNAEPLLQRVDGQRHARVLHNAVDDALNNGSASLDIATFSHGSLPPAQKEGNCNARNARACSDDRWRRQLERTRPVITQIHSLFMIQ